MAETKVVALVLICVILAVSFGGVMMLYKQTQEEVGIKTDQISELENDKNTLETQVSSLQTDNTDLNSQVSSLESEVTSLQGETDSLESQVSTLETQKEDLEGQVSGLESENSLLTSSVSSLESQVSTLQGQVTDLQGQVVQNYDLGFSEGETEGYQLGYDVGYSEGMEDLTENGYYLRDPTYEEAMSFIQSDTTDLHPYTSSYVCYDFTADFNKNAAQQGYRCGFVYIEYASSAHAIACFNTTNQGLIYIEPQNDHVVTIAVGQTYLGHVIVDMGIIW